MSQIVFTVKPKDGFDIFEYKLSIYQDYYLRIIRILDAACKLQDKYFPEEKRSLCALVILFPYDGYIFPFPVFQLKREDGFKEPETKYRGRIRNAIEKVTRIWIDNSESSFEGRDFENGKYGGGRRVESLIIGVSAFKEKIDDAASFATGMVLGDKKPEEIKVSAHKEGLKIDNEFYKELVEIAF